MPQPKRGRNMKSLYSAVTSTNILFSKNGGRIYPGEFHFGTSYYFGVSHSQINLCATWPIASNGSADHKNQFNKRSLNKISLIYRVAASGGSLSDTQYKSQRKTAQQSGQKILLVDDSSTTLLIEEMTLREHTQYELVTARDGEEAVEKAIAEQPNLILMDVVMPRMNGFDACREMRKHEALRKVPIIMVTSRGESCNVEQGFESGCNDYVTKPINGAELVEIVNGYLVGQGQSQ
jgi:two-component system, OmpR family, alkaline phosphatase synthesis response regulator PhoP